MGSVNPKLKHVTQPPESTYNGTQAEHDMSMTQESERDVRRTPGARAGWTWHVTQCILKLIFVFEVRWALDRRQQRHSLAAHARPLGSAAHRHTRCQLSVECLRWCRRNCILEQAQLALQLVVLELPVQLRTTLLLEQVGVVLLGVLEGLPPCKGSSSRY